MKKRGQDSASQKIFDGTVREISAVAFAISSCTLAESRFAVFGLANPRQQSIPGEHHFVERSAKNHAKFLFGRKRWYLPCVLQGQEIGQGEKKPVIRCAFYLALRACAARN